ncbi:MAG: hypothetical protein V3R85_09905 [Alphaproteobacteria bacterium]
MSARAAGTTVPGIEATPRKANSDARTAADIGFATRARVLPGTTTIKTLFDAQSIATEAGMFSGVSPATPGLDSIALRAGTRLSVQVAENRQGIDNTAKASSLFTAALDGLDEIEALLNRLETLAADAALTDLDTTDDDEPPTALSDQQRARMNTEFAELRAEIDTLVGDKVVGGTSVLGGFSFSVAVGGGGVAGDSLTVGLDSAASADLATGFDSDDISSLTGATTALTNVQAALDTVGDLKAQARSSQNRLGYAANTLAATTDVVDAERTRRLTPAPELDLSGDIAKGVLAQRGISDAAQGQDINLTLLSQFTGVAAPDAPETTETDEGTAATPSPAPAPKPAPAPTFTAPEPTGQTVSISV